MLLLLLPVAVVVTPVATVPDNADVEQPAVDVVPPILMLLLLLSVGVACLLPCGER